MMSGPGAMVSSAEATRKSAISGMLRNEKAPCEDGALSWRKEPSGLRRLDRHGRLVVGAALRVLDLAGHRREERVVLADADVLPGMEFRAALAHENGTRVHLLAA